MHEYRRRTKEYKIGETKLIVSGANLPESVEEFFLKLIELSKSWFFRFSFFQLLVELLLICYIQSLQMEKQQPIRTSIMDKLYKEMLGK